MTNLSDQLEALAAQWDGAPIVEVPDHLFEAILSALRAREWQPDDASVERVARALCRMQWLDVTSPDDADVTAAVDRSWQDWKAEARAAIAAMPTPPAPGDA